MFVVNNAAFLAVLISTPPTKGAFSALFIQKLASDAKELSKDDSIVTLENVRQAAQEHDFLKGVMDNVTEQSAPKRPRKKKPKLDSSVKDVAVKKAMVDSAATAAASFQPEVTLDEDDYD